MKEMNKTLKSPRIVSLMLSPIFLLLFFILLNESMANIRERPQAVAAYHNRTENFIAPNDWGTIWPNCSGDAQTPIDITVPPTHKNFAPGDLPLKIDIHSCHYVYDSDTDELDMSPKWQFVDNDCFAWGQNSVPHRIFHCNVNAPAEHTLNGTRYDAEFHVGWQYMDTNSTLPKVLAMGFLFQGRDGAADHPLLAKLIDIQLNNTTKTNPASLGPDWPTTLGLRSNSSYHDVTFFNYFGSGNVPPCLAGIDWWIADTAVEVSQSQIDAIYSIIRTMERSDDGNNARPVQELGVREVRTGNYTLSEEDDGTSGAYLEKVTPLTTLASRICSLSMML